MVSLGILELPISQAATLPVAKFTTNVSVAESEALVFDRAAHGQRFLLGPRVRKRRGVSFLLVAGGMRGAPSENLRLIGL